MSSHKFYLNFNPKDSKNGLSSLSTQDLKTIFSFTQPKSALDGSETPTNLYFAGTKAQKPKKHFDSFNSYFCKAEDAANYQPFDHQILMERFTIGFDSDDGNNKILKWSEGKKANPHYDPKSFVLGNANEKDIDEELLQDIPQVDGGDCDDHSLNKRVSSLNLTQSLEQTDPPVDDVELIQEKEDVYNEKKTLNEENTENEKEPKSSDASSASFTESQTNSQLTPLHKNVLASAEFDTMNHVEKFLNYSNNHNMSHHRVQAATQNISSRYLSLLAYYELKFGDPIAEQFARLEKRELKGQIVNELSERCVACKQDLIKKRIISKDGF